MLRSLFVASILPIAIIYVVSLLPASLKEPYAWLDPIALNSPAEDGLPRRWFNMGHWEGTESFSDAAEQLARRLLEFADAPQGGTILDIAHGSGESILLHLSASPPRTRIDALASLKADTARARALVLSHKANHSISTPVDFFTASAVPQLGKVGDQDHPLNPMHGYLGTSKTSYSRADIDDYDNDEDGEDGPDGSDGQAGFASASKAAGKGYNLVYVLDAIYHFPPSLPSFLTLVQTSLAPGGVVAYTDLLPPPHLNPIVGRLLALIFGVPVPNLAGRPASLSAYETDLQRLGYTGVRVEDWSAAVWPGFARNLEERGGAWAAVGWVVQRAERAGWRFLAVRAQKRDSTDDA